MKLRTLGAAIGVSFLAATASFATTVAFDFEWDGARNHSMVGSFSGVDANMDGFIRDDEVTALSFEGFRRSRSLGVTSNAHTLAGFNFNFDLSGPGFALGGLTSSDSGQQWNVANSARGLGFESGNASASFYRNGNFRRVSQTANPNSIAVSPAPVPVPAGLPLLLGGLGLLGLARRVRRKS